MTRTHALPPIPFDPAIEEMEENEARLAEKIDAKLNRLQEITFSDYGHAQRSVHAKSHGLIEATFEVLDHLPAELAQGLYAKPGKYPAIMRFSTIPGDVLDDSVVVPYGLAVKVIGAEGQYLPDTKGVAVQDLLMVNSPTFASPNLKSFYVGQVVLTATTDTGQFWKKWFSAAMRRLARAVDAFGGDSSGLRQFGGPPPHPLGETYYSQTPYRFGRYVAKFAIFPSSPTLRALTGTPIAVKGRPNALREEVIQAFHRSGGEWEVRVQLRNDPAMPVEDSTVRWSEEQSPFRTVARIKAKPQPAWSEARAQQVDDGLSFAPWHAMVDHQPLGSINRARRPAYPNAARFREAHNNHPIVHPKDRVELSDAPACPYGFAPGREGLRPNTPDARAYGLGQPLNKTARKVLFATAGVGIIALAVFALRRKGDD